MKYKGLEYLIAAQPEISREVSNAKIIIAGAGDFTLYEGFIKDRSAFEIINQHIPDEDVALLFQQASVVVLPYIGGSQTGVVPIAYSFKKAVIVTDVGGLGEAVDDGINGLVVPPHDQDALAMAIVRLLKDEPLRKRMGEAGNKKAESELSWDKIADQTIVIYGNVIKVKK
jgi:glycosyltransferase involved in cell wall biosynthesis